MNNETSVRSFFQKGKIEITNNYWGNNNPDDRINQILKEYKRFLSIFRNEINTKRKGDMYSGIEYLNSTVYPFVLDGLVSGCSEDLINMAYELSDIYDHISEYQRSDAIVSKILSIIQSNNAKHTYDSLKKMIGCIYSQVIRKDFDCLQEKERCLDSAENQMNQIEPIINKMNFDSNAESYFLRGQFESIFGALYANKADLEMKKQEYSEEKYSQFLHTALSHHQKAESIRKQLVAMNDRRFKSDATSQLYQSKSNIAGIEYRLAQFESAIEKHLEVLNYRMSRKDVTKAFLSKLYILGCYCRLLENGKTLSARDEEQCKRFLTECSDYYRQTSDILRINEIENKAKVIAQFLH